MRYSCDCLSSKGTIMTNFFKKYPFQIFLFLHFALWSFIPLLRKSLPMDSIEAISWGKFCDFGTNKHPPLSGWLAGFFYQVLGFETPFSIYVLNQLCVIVGLIYVYRLAYCFVSKEKAILSAMLLEGVIYYGFSSLEYNVNVVSLALWPMCAYYFYQALHKQKLSDWILFGLLAGLNLLNKYTSAILLFSMGLYLIFDGRARASLKNYKLYLSVLVGVLVVAPHLWWLYQHDFFVLNYFVGRSSQSVFDNIPFLNHVVYPLKFIGAQVLFALGTLLVYFISSIKETKVSTPHGKEDINFLIYLGVLPVVLMFCISLVFGMKLKSMWGFPTLYLLGLLLMVFRPYAMTEKFKKKIVLGVYIVMILFASAQALVICLNKSDKFQLDTKEYGKMVETLWRQNSDKPFAYVAGDVWWANNAALFAPSKPKPIIWGDVNQNPWFELKDIQDKGALVLTSDEFEYFEMQKKLGFDDEPKVLGITVKNRLSKTKEKTIYYGFYHN